MLSADAIVKLHDEMTRAWHIQPGSDSVEYANLWLARVARQHRANFELWHIEDEARAPGATDAQLAQVKRRIDSTNQLRNDLAEELDRALLEWLAPQHLPAEGAPLQSESPGLIIDRLSILALKIYHTREEAERSDVRPSTPSETAPASPSLKSSATTWPAASTPCGVKPWPAPGASNFTASSRCTTTPRSILRFTAIPLLRLGADLL